MGHFSSMVCRRLAMHSLRLLPTLWKKQRKLVGCRKRRKRSSIPQASSTWVSFSTTIGMCLRRTLMYKLYPRRNRYGRQPFL